EFTRVLFRSVKTVGLLVALHKASEAKLALHVKVVVVEAAVKVVASSRRPNLTTSTISPRCELPPSKLTQQRSSQATTCSEPEEAVKRRRTIESRWRSCDRSPSRRYSR